MERAELPRKLGLLDSTAIVVGTVIGSAIFLVPNAVAQDLPSVKMVLAVWILTGVLSFFGALAYAELGAMTPSTGGQYVYLRDSFGPLWAFLCGWAFFLVIQSGGIATLAAGFSIYLSYFVPMGPLYAKLASVGLISILSYVSYRGVKGGAAVQKLFTLLKITGLAILIGSVFVSRQPNAFQWSSPSSGFSWSHFGVAMIACLWAYEGWNQVSFVAGEVKQPQRNLPLSLGIGMAIVIAIYVTANIAYMKILPISEIASTERVAATVAGRTMGRIGATVVSLTILLSITGALNGSILTAPRVYFAQSRDGLFFKKAGEVHPRFQTPHVSILLQGIWSAILAISGSYQKLFSFVIFSAWVFYGMTVAAVVILRWKYPDRQRPYKMWGYPVTPLLFSAISFWFVANTVVTTPGPSLIGVLIIASGVPVYYIWRHKFRIEDGVC
ncbi:MAG TPA: amino acid permease [Acidobacteriota bacterium]|jgi:APA family basic amino acid/polyamine antiporter